MGCGPELKLEKKKSPVMATGDLKYDNFRNGELERQYMQDDLETQEKISYDKNEQEVIVRHRKKRITGTFAAIGELTTMKTREKKADIFDKLGDVSKGAYHVFVELKCRRDPENNLAHYPTTHWTSSQRQQFSRYLKELRAVNIVRVALRQMETRDPQVLFVSKKQTYMLNPDLLKCWNYEEAALLWDQCKH